jgi:hypothetical protein
VGEVRIELRGRVGATPSSFRLPHTAASRHDHVGEPDLREPVGNQGVAGELLETGQQDRGAVAPAVADREGRGELLGGLECRTSLHETRLHIVRQDIDERLGLPILAVPFTRVRTDTAV